LISTFGGWFSLAGTGKFFSGTIVLLIVHCAETVHFLYGFKSTAAHAPERHYLRARQALIPAREL